MVTSTHVAKCNKCSKTIEVSGSEATRAQLAKKMGEAKWMWKDSTTHYCPDHRPSAARAPKKAKAKKAAKKAAPKKPAKKVHAAPTEKKGLNAKPRRVPNPMVVLGGGSTGNPSSPTEAVEGDS